MAVKRIEVAILADDAEEDAIPLLTSFVSAIGLNVKTDVAAVVTADQEGDPVVVAIVYPGAGLDDDLDPTEMLIEADLEESEL